MIARALATLLVAGSCVAQAPAPPAVSRGGTVAIAWQQPATLHPLWSTGTQTDAMVYALSVEGLLRIGPDGEQQPALAREVPTPANGGVRIEGGGMTVTYRLVPGVRWSDGAPFTSEDVRYTWQAVMTDPKVASREGYSLIERVDTPDDVTVVVRYRQPYVAYTTRFSTIVPKHVLERGEAAQLEYSRLPIGTGPFRLVEHRSGDQIVAERNPHYRIAGRPYLDRVVFRSVTSVEAAKAQLRAGEVHVSASLSEADVAQLEGLSTIRVERARSPIVEALALNLRAPGAADGSPHPVLGDLAVRRALLLATPKAEIVARLLGGRTSVGTSEIPAGWASPSGLEQERYDPALARRVLDGAGWTVGRDGIREKAGVRAGIRLTSTTGNALREQIQQVLVDEWRAVGIEATIRNIPSAVLTASWSASGVRKRGDFDIVLAQAGIDLTSGGDPQPYLAQRRTCSAIPRAANQGGGANYERFCDARVDAIIEKAAGTIDRDGRRALYADALRLIDAEIPNIWLFDRTRFDAVATALQGARSNAWHVLTWNVEEWSLHTP